MDDSERRAAAIRRLKTQRDFKRSLLIYVVVNAFLVVIWALGDRGYFWPVWVILGWGLGVAIQGWNAYFRKPISEEDIRREMERGL